MNKDSLGDRMKGYEKVPSDTLIKKMPVVIRLDGKAFHTYTKGMDRPLDEDLHVVRQSTLEYLCNNIQGALFGYSQSDEISIVLKDWDTYQTDCWFGNKIQKICSVSASMCTAMFNKFGMEVDELNGDKLLEDDQYMTLEEVGYEGKFSHKIALFDSRCWNLPKEEVVNYLIWRQQDWERNSVQLYAQNNYSHKSLQGLSCKTLITKLEDEKGIVWGNLEPWKKRGEFWIKSAGIIDTPLFKEERETLDNILKVTYNER